MSVLIAHEAPTPVLIEDAEVEDICSFVLASEGVERPVEISLTWVDDGRMRDLNAAWRGVDRVTDVLSFECDAPDAEVFPGEVVELGDIVLAPAQIARQASGFGNTAADECRLMLVHAMLHLLGYDHIEEDEALVMEAREDELLRELALRRGDDPAAVTVGPMTRHRAEEEGDRS